MASGWECPACGEWSRAQACPSCGADLRPASVGEIGPRTLRDRDETALERDQTLGDRDQAASDEDQTWSDHDQTSSESDQQTADEDQRASDVDFAAGGNARIHRRSAQAREKSARDRAAVSNVRDETAAARLGTAEDRDRAAALRDLGAEGRDRLARLHDLDDDTNASRHDILLRAKRDRERAAADRAKAAEDRARAAVDREEAARARFGARRERAEFADALTLAATDTLTGAWTRQFGLQEVSHELDRAHRTGARLLLAFIDVDDLKQVNDSRGHLAGDELLRLLGETLRANVRPYDVLVRYGGDELLCAMPNIGHEEAKARFEAVAASISMTDAEHSITVGLAEAEPGDDLHHLIGRADAELLKARRSSEGDG